MFETFSKQPLRKLHEIVKKILRKKLMQISKVLFFNVIRESSAMKYALTNAA